MHTHSSAGRAPLLQSGGPWFESKCVYHPCDVSSVGTERRFAMPARRISAASIQGAVARIRVDLRAPGSFRPQESNHRMRIYRPRSKGSTPSRRATHRSSMNHAALAQRIRVPGFDPGGRGFKSCTPHQSRRPLIAIVTVLRRVPIEAYWRCLESRWSVTDTKVRLLHPPPQFAEEGWRSGRTRSA